ncbi:MAG: RNA polymerase sigma factor [Firmicutes bacterium]|nr:RNA polymerase sigma factor [Bacillota bacterium]
MKMPVTDELIVYKAKNGDLQAYGALVERYQHKVYNLAVKMVSDREDARDLTQDIFMQIFQTLPRFRGDSSFSTWVYRVASNKCLDFARKKKSEREKVNLSTFDLENLPSDSRGSPEEHAIRDDENHRLKRALESLPKDYLIVIVLQHFQQMSYKEIAEVLDVPVKTVATRLYRAKSMLKERLMGGDAGAMPSGKAQPGQLHGKGISAL